MNCQLFRTQIHTWRNHSDRSDFEPLFQHMETCPGCTNEFRVLIEQDERLRRTIRSVSDQNFLEQRIMAGLRHDRCPSRTRLPRLAFWIIGPALVFLGLAALLIWTPSFHRQPLQNELGSLVLQPPPSEVVSTDRQALLSWSASILHISPQLPPELGRVQFKGATALEVTHHKAVLLKMKNEPRASLLVIDGSLTSRSGFTYIAVQNGNASLWSHGNNTYALLFHGNRRDMETYMQKVGITSAS